MVGLDKGFMYKRIFFIFFIILQSVIQAAEKSKIFIKVPSESQVLKEEYFRSWCAVNKLNLCDVHINELFESQWHDQELQLLPGRYKKKSGAKISRISIFLYTIMEKELIADHISQLDYHRFACKVTGLPAFLRPQVYMEYRKMDCGEKLAVTHNGVVALSKLASHYKNPEYLVDQFGKKESLLDPSIEAIKKRAMMLRRLDQEEKHSDATKLK